MFWVYPRECGGTLMNGADRLIVPGLSPRVRGNRLPRLAGCGVRGSIPASAGEPSVLSKWSCARGVYPRECGGTVMAKQDAGDSVGLSPRVRGNRPDE